MKKKFLIIGGILLLIIGIIILNIFLSKEEKDSVKFKNEYSYLDINKNNPFIYKSAIDIVSMINDKKSFLVYLGYPDDENVKIFIPNLVKFLDDNNVEEIYYVNIENIRNEVSYNGKSLETIKIGTKGYYDLIKLLDDFLDDYYVSNNNGKKVLAGKRIEAPSLLVVEKGEPIKLIHSSDELDSIKDLIKPSYMCEDNTGC